MVVAVRLRPLLCGCPVLDVVRLGGVFSRGVGEQGREAVGCGLLRSHGLLSGDGCDGAGPNVWCSGPRQGPANRESARTRPATGGLERTTSEVFPLRPTCEQLG